MIEKLKGNTFLYISIGQLVISRPTTEHREKMRNIARKTNNMRERERETERERDRERETERERERERETERETERENEKYS